MELRKRPRVLQELSSNTEHCVWLGGQRSAKWCRDAAHGRDVAPDGRSSFTAAFAGFTWWEKRNRRREGILQKVYLKDF